MQFPDMLTISYVQQVIIITVNYNHAVSTQKLSHVMVRKANGKHIENQSVTFDIQSCVSLIMMVETA